MANKNTLNGNNNSGLEKQQQQTPSPELTISVSVEFPKHLQTPGQHGNNLLHTKIRKSILKTTNQSAALAAEKANTPREEKAIMQMHRVPEFLCALQWS